MSGKVAKRLRKLADTTGQSYKQLKKDYHK